MMHLARLAGLGHDTDASSQLVSHEMLMYCSDRQQRTDGHTLTPCRTIRQHQQRKAAFNRLRCFLADPFETPAQSRITLRARERDVDRLRLPVAVAEMPNRRQLLVSQDRVRHDQPMTLPLCRIKQIPFRPDETLQRHDDLFANRIERRIRHLREELLEVVVNQPRLIAQTGQRRVVSHRTERVFLCLDHRDQHELQSLGCVPERLHLLD